MFSSSYTKFLQVFIIMYRCQIIVTCSPSARRACTKPPPRFSSSHADSRILGDDRVGNGAYEGHGYGYGTVRHIMGLCAATSMSLKLHADSRILFDDGVRNGSPGVLINVGLGDPG